MRLYIDHDLAGRELVTRLRNEGHDVEIPRDVGLAAVSDPVQFTAGNQERLPRIPRDEEGSWILHHRRDCSG
jgi:hypothetical protein